MTLTDSPPGAYLHCTSGRCLVLFLSAVCEVHACSYQCERTQQNHFYGRTLNKKVNYSRQGRLSSTCSQVRPPKDSNATKAIPPKYPKGKGGGKGKGKQKGNKGKGMGERVVTISNNRDLRQVCLTDMTGDPRSNRGCCIVVVRPDQIRSCPS